ncbi:uncharacterized protein LOC101859084 isoform X2 [Aplysia californica]|uniref:Uncharacterized protein LOC101859084 isoform X2 n=1 Tax=Aplysia californica TaxID=6500 RepID=A0ABM0JHH6_APLCA|nr:uncharacterized protein LOC101859084 isoform X2 [Aplysia californica]XP_005093766.1 uncharacterized protein LOC101859084 isoform X2 [Aplysia californica]XP_035824467.1 uncharacterized protein LOC101859084 isoform X2 [Aplysia californica]XP_035824468.1 uncharacterized protein LOC101859084 isoform X2 [Aplysia californica]
MTSTWETFVSDNLLDSNLFSGVCLLSNQRDVIFSHGSLTKLSQAEIDQFFQSFSCGETDPCYRSFHLSAGKAQGSESYKIYYRTHISLYATSAGNRSGLTVSKLEQGIFLTLFHKPVLPQRAISVVERFTGMLRF